MKKSSAVAKLPRPNFTSFVDKLYGTTNLGGGATNCVDGCGIVYSLSRKTGREEILYAFQNVPDGAAPNGLIAVGGTLYGTTSSGGTGFDGGGGIVFSITP